MVSRPKAASLVMRRDVRVKAGVLALRAVPKSAVERARRNRVASQRMMWFWKGGGC